MSAYGIEYQIKIDRSKLVQAPTQAADYASEKEIKETFGISKFGTYETKMIYWAKLVQLI